MVSILNATGTSVTFKAGVTSFGTPTMDLGSSTFTADRYPNLKLWLDANDLLPLTKASILISQVSQLIQTLLDIGETRVVRNTTPKFIKVTIITGLLIGQLV